MSALEYVVMLIGLAGTISSILFAFISFKRNDSSDKKKEGKNEGVLISDIGYIKSSIDRMERKLDKQEERYQSLLSRVIKLEENYCLLKQSQWKKGDNDG